MLKQFEMSFLYNLFIFHHSFLFDGFSFTFHCALEKIENIYSIIILPIHYNIIYNASPSKNPVIKTPLVARFSLGVVFNFSPLAAF